LVVGEARDHAEEFLKGLAPLRELGFEIAGELMNGAGARELEPALSEAVTAGVLIGDHWHVDPTTLTAGLAARLAELGVAIRPDAEVVGFHGRDGQVREVQTADGAFAADDVVLAAGAWTPALARRLGLRVPVRPGKGYSFELLAPRTLRRPLMLLEPHVAVSPFGDRLRIAGTMEFSGVNERLDHRRIGSIIRGSARLLPLAAEHEPTAQWTGMRPIAPDGLPIIDRSPRHRNVYLATAYSMLGITLAAPAGQALAEMILTGRRPPELEPFRAKRFWALR
jgi:D-amino-acid dehydrogenase